MAAQQPEIILCTLGTRGDILPLIALGAVLKRRGRDIIILANDNWTELVESIDVPFHAIGPQDPTQSGRDDFAFFLNNALPAHRRTFAFVSDQVAAGARPLLVYQPFMLGAECAALRFGLPNIKLALQPLMIKSKDRPPWPLAHLVDGPLGGICKRTLLPLLTAVSDAVGNLRGYRRHSRAFRRSVGVAPARAEKSVEDMSIVLCPSWFAMPQKDWPSNCRMVGFPFWDLDHQDPELEQFIAEYGRPLVFTPGTGVVDVAAFFARARDICKQLDLPGVFVSPLAPASDARDWPHIVSRASVPLEWLTPRARLLVHHGGIGTTAQAIRAAIPQIILPDRFDQPDNALRVAQLRLGAIVMSQHVAATEWVALIRQLLSDPVMQARLDRASRDVRASSAASDAVDLIESVLEAPAMLRDAASRAVARAS